MELNFVSGTSKPLRDDRHADRLSQAKLLAGALRRERARAGQAGYDLQRHRRLVRDYAACIAGLPRSQRPQARKEFLHKKENKL